MDKALKKHLRKIVDMYIGDEQRHFMEAPCKKHIYASLKKVDEFLVGDKKETEKSVIK